MWRILEAFILAETGFKLEGGIFAGAACDDMKRQRRRRTDMLIVNVILGIGIFAVGRGGYADSELERFWDDHRWLKYTIGSHIWKR